MAGESGSDATVRLKVDFAILDEDTNLVIHAVLAWVDPDSIAFFKFDQDSSRKSATGRPQLAPAIQLLILLIEERPPGLT